MTRARIGLGIVLVLAGLWVIGFTGFLNTNAARPTLTPDDDIAVGIVVLTGSAGRIQAGMDALARGDGDRLLISGVNESTTAAALQALVDDPGGLFESHVDLGYEALTTSSNAAEAIVWAEAHGFAGLVIVTSYYHMPRAILEFRNRGPELALYPNRVEPDDYSADNWWYPNTLRILALEYTKYELALWRIRFTNLF